MKPPRKGPVSLDSIIKSQTHPENKPTQSKNWNVRDAYSMVTQKPTVKDKDLLSITDNLNTLKDFHTDQYSKSVIEPIPQSAIEAEPFIGCLHKISSLTTNEVSCSENRIVEDHSPNSNINGVETESKRSLNGNENELTVTKRSLNEPINGNETVTKTKLDQKLTVTERSLNGNENELTVTKRSLNEPINGNETVTKTKLDQKLTVTERSLNGNENLIYDSLIGNEKKIVDLVFHQCQISAALTTPPINIDLIRTYLGPLSSGSIKMAVQRVILKKVIYRAERKNGRAGWIKFAMNQQLYNHLVFRFTVTERSLNGKENENINKINGNETVTERSLNGNVKGNETPSSMYVGINKNTIHTYENQIPEIDSWSELRDINFSSTDQFGIRSNVIETFRKNKWVITREQLEEHLERFVRYFTEKEFEKRREPIKNPYSFFLSSIKAISKGEPDPICDIETHFEISQKLAVQNKIKSMEIRRREFDAVEKQMDQYRDSEFEHWVTGLTDEEKIQIVPPNKIAELGSGRYKILLKDYFNQTVWIEIRQSVLNGHRS
jgi:hypothetical protein